ncbi:hypothetical protein CsatB_004676 [Cannabis sativa]
MSKEEERVSKIQEEENIGNHHNNNDDENKKKKKRNSDFEMPLHYPRYKKRDYEIMAEWKLDLLLTQYGLPTNLGDDDDDDDNLNHKRKFAMGAFLWPSQYHQ